LDPLELFYHLLDAKFEVNLFLTLVARCFALTQHVTVHVVALNAV